MRYIAKRKGPVHCLYNENLNPPTTEDESKRRWKRFVRSRNYSILVDMLREEQFYLCAYSEISPENHGLSTHVEHVKPKSVFPESTFDYINLVSSVLSSDDLKGLKILYVSEPISCFGGHAKRSRYDKNYFMSPLRRRAKRKYLLYLSDGRVVPNPKKTRRYQKKADHTIKLLNLNHPMLVALRKEWIEELDALIDQHLDDDMCLTSLAEVDLLPINGRLSNFFSATCQRFSNSIVNEILRTYR